MINHLIYGKIIIDDLQLADGSIAHNVLGGGGPQALFGARLWHESIGFLSRSGTDLDAIHVEKLQRLQVDLSGWHLYPEIPTPYNRLYSYDEEGYLQTGDGELLMMAIDQEAWDKLLAQPLDLPPSYQQPTSIHLITEFFDEPMVDAALSMRAQGAIVSLEPIIDYAEWKNLDGLFPLLEKIDILTPDWPSASGIAKSQDPEAVLAFWSKLGPDLVAIRHGERGSYIWSKAEGAMWHIPVLPVNVVDPTGAGNSYGGGLCVGWAEHQDARMAGCYGTISARYLVEHVGVPEFGAGLGAEAAVYVETLMEQIKEIT